MKRVYIKITVLLILICLTTRTTFAWGKTGHDMVAEIAFHLISESTKENVKHYLGNTSFEQAANWMDEMRGNPEYDFMRPWHYLDADKEELYSPTSSIDNIVSRLTISYSDLQHHQLLCAQQVKTDLLYMFHLIGDLHQPLHCGYNVDRGANSIEVNWQGNTSNLHALWDGGIIDNSHINVQDCLSLYKNLSPDQLRQIKTIDFIFWYNESRSFLDDVYDFTQPNINQSYINKNKIVIEKRLLYAGIRLAAVLDKLFGTDASLIVLPVQNGNTITAEDAINYIGKNVKVCTKVYSVKSLEKVSFIDVGARYPNSTLTIVIFAKDRDKFKPSIEQLYNGKNICITGKVELYKNKPQIIVSGPGDIIIQ
jgi:hypothetical protein